jgi:uncharacterized protein DUF1579
MNKTLFLGTIAIGLFAASAARAQSEKPTVDPAKEAAPPAGKMEMPKPSKELEDVVKSMSGKWKCAGKDEGSPMMPPHKVEGTLTWKADLDKYWIVGSYEEKKTKENPHPFRFTEYRNFDTTTKKWTSVMIDNMGMYSTGTGEGDAKMVKWDLKSQGMGMTMPMHMTEEAKSPKEVSVKGEGAPDGTNFKPMFEVTCKK